MLPGRTARTPRIISTTSAILHQTMTVRLLKRSARYPAGAASNG